MRSCRRTGEVAAASETSGVVDKPDIRAATGVARRDVFLHAMRRVATTVAIVTTDGEAGRHGATVSSFCSVSADPPTLLVCLRAGSRIADAVRCNAVFTLNVLDADRADLARLFAGAYDADGRDRFEGVALARVEGLAPALRGATVMACRLTKALREASHLVCVGEVTFAAPGAASPLAYLGGAYCRVTPQHQTTTP